MFGSRTVGRKLLKRVVDDLMEIVLEEYHRKMRAETAMLRRPL